MEYHDVRGVRVPAVGLGTWQLHRRTCETAVRHALEIGYRHIDTAEAYGNETEVGRGVRAAEVDREVVFLTTKVWWEHLAPSAVRRSAEQSLRRLGVEYVDLLLIHWPAADVPLERSLEAMMRLREEQKARCIGVSNFPPRLLMRACELAPIFCEQAEYHPYLDQQALLAATRERDLLFTAYCPLAQGEVTDDATLRAIGARHGKTAAQVTLRWLVQQRVAVIPRASTAEHRAANLAISDFRLSADEMIRIADLAVGRRLIDPSFAPDWGDAAG